MNEDLDPERAFEWPRDAMRDGDWSIAGGRWRVMRKVYPDHPAPWFQGIASHLRADELDQAQGLIDIAQEKYPNHPSALILPAELAIKREQWPIAQGFVTQAQELHAANPQTWIVSADLAELCDDYEEASACLSKAIEYAPDRPNLLKRYAELAMDAGKYEEAQRRWGILRDRFSEVQAGYQRGAQAASLNGDNELSKSLLLKLKYGSDYVAPEGYVEDVEAVRAKPSQSPLMMLFGLIWTKAVFNLHSEVRRNYLSFGWWVIEPLMYMAVYQLVFGLLLNRGGENYSVLLMTGLIPWMWTLKAISASSGSILGGQGLMLQVGVHPIMFPMVMLVQATVKQIPIFILLMGFVWFNGIGPGSHWLMLLPIMLVQLLFTTAASLAVAGIMPFVRDLLNLVPTGLTLLMFLSGIFYDYRTIDEKWHNLFLLNPVAFLIKCYREVLVDRAAPDFSALAWRGALCAIACSMLVVMYHRLRYVYPRAVME